LVGDARGFVDEEQETAEKPRLVASVAGSPTMRDWLGKAKEIWLSPSPLGLMPSLRAKAAALRRNSALWRALGLTTRVRLAA